MYCVIAVMLSTIIMRSFPEPLMYIIFFLSGLAIVAADSIRFAVLGDWGYSGRALHNTAKALYQNTYDFLVLGGDNFYENGIRDTNDGLIKTVYEDTFLNRTQSMDHPLHTSIASIPHYAILGNHDYRGNVLAQIAYSGNSKNWRMPAAFYFEILKKGATQICVVFIDTTQFARDIEQIDFLSTTLDSNECKSSNAVIVVGHHPIFSSGYHGDSKKFKIVLLPILREYHVDLYISGHDHILAHYEDQEVHFVVSGSASKLIDSVWWMQPTRAERTFYETLEHHGFAEIAVAGNNITVKLKSSDGGGSASLSETGFVSKFGKRSSKNMFVN